MKRSILLIATVVILVLCISPMAFATESEISTKEAAALNISNFLLDQEESVGKLNRVADSLPIDVQEYTLENGDIVRKEVRELEVSHDLKITNIRTFVIRGTTYEVEDSYGLFWGGQIGGGGWLVAEYEYEHPTINSPNDMTTLILDADGRCEDLISQYRLINTEETWDDEESYNPSAEVVFEMEVKVGLFWQDITYTNTCEFDRYGVPDFSWFD